jgi:alpha-beta hydrolase superfamily lysophospholipase
VPEQVAVALGANLFETRLAGHGLEQDALVGMSAEQWLEDGSEALAVGKALGERLILMGTSTGATLALSLAQHPQFSAVEALILLSPNFGPSARGSGLATGPMGPQLIRLMAGEYREWEPSNERQGRYWHTRYPTTAAIELMRLVDLAVAETAAARVPKAMLIYSPNDQVVSVKRLLRGFERLPAGEKAVHQILSGGGPSNHVLAGDILAPENNLTTSAMITSFLRTD